MDDDEEDWVGTPPEGRHSGDRARPDFWWRQWQVSALSIGMVVVIAVVVVVLVVS